MPDAPTPDDSPRTQQLHAWLERIEAGDLAAREELLRGVAAELERLARGMLRRFPAVARWEQTGDVLNAALLRLMRALREVRPESMRQFYGLAAEQVRRELLDLARRYKTALSPAARHATPPPGRDAAPPDVPAAGDEADLERWCAFHEEVARLPAEEREVVGLVFYHGWTQEQAAELCGVTPRTVQRWWHSALRKLRRHYREMHGGA